MNISDCNCMCCSLATILSQYSNTSMSPFCLPFPSGSWLWSRDWRALSFTLTLCHVSSSCFSVKSILQYDLSKKQWKRKRATQLCQTWYLSIFPQNILRNKRIKSSDILTQFTDCVFWCTEILKMYELKFNFNSGIKLRQISICHTLANICKVLSSEAKRIYCTIMIPNSSILYSRSGYSLFPEDLSMFFNDTQTFPLLFGLEREVADGCDKLWHAGKGRPNRSHSSNYCTGGSTKCWIEGLV